MIAKMVVWVVLLSTINWLLLVFLKLAPSGVQSVTIQF